jgi:hypothetical protein
MLARTDETEDDFLKSPQNEIGLLLQTMKMAAGRLEELSHDAEARDAMVDDAGDISAVTLAMNLIWSRVSARSAA